MKTDTDRECSTIPLILYKERLSHMKLDPSTVELHQYDGIPLIVKGVSKITLQKGQKTMPGSFVLFGNAHNQLPLLVRN